MAVVNRRGAAPLEVRDLHLAFDGVQALAGVDLDAAPGELVAVIGPNGAGKTSLFNCISGVVRPQRGTVRLGGRTLSGLSPAARVRLGLGRTFQHPTLLPHLPVLDNLLLGRHVRYGTPWWVDLLGGRRWRAEEVRHREAVEAIIDFLHLERWRWTPAGALPYGVLKRVDLGRALATDPCVLLLDEPAAGLNREETEDMARALLDLRAEWGITQVLIEHELAMVLDIADRVQVLDFGTCIAAGPPEAIRRHPAVRRAYLGSEA